MFGVPAPQVVKRQAGDGTWELHEPYVENGQTAIEWAGGIDEAAAQQMGLSGGDRDPQDMYDSPGGRLIGLADKATQASDRHMGNWMVAVNPDTGEQYPVPINNDQVQLGYGADASSPFADYLEIGQLAAEHPPADWDAWKDGLAALEPEFAGLGMTTEHANVVHNLRAMRLQAF